MTSQHLDSNLNRKTLGDTAVDGLLAGLVGGLAMLGLLLLVELVNGESVAVVIGRFDVAQTNNLITSFFTHMAVASIYSVIFSLIYLLLVRLWPSLIRFGWVVGPLYGLLLYGLVQSAVLAGFELELAEFSAGVFLVAHALYGLVLGTLLSRKWQETDVV